MRKKKTKIRKILTSNTEGDVGRMFNAKEESLEIIDWLKNFEIKKATIGISGGKDSTVVAKLLSEALGKENVHGILLTDDFESEDYRMGKEVVDYLGINHKDINISSAYRSITTLYNFDEPSSKNNLSRLRTLILYGISQTIGDGSRVVGTTNLSEKTIGWVTKWGDNVADLEPIINFTSKEVVEIGRALDIPDRLIERIPEDGITG